VSQLSEQDITDMTHEEISVIIVVNDKRRSSPWQYNEDGTLSGTVDKYHFRISAYYLDPHSKTRRASIFCPYAIGFSAKEIPPKVFMRAAGSSPRWLRSKA
jgi:hypothetical protein